MLTTTVKLRYLYATGTSRLYSTADTNYPGPDQKVWIPFSLIQSTSGAPGAPNQHLVELPTAFVRQLKLTPVTS